MPQPAELAGALEEGSRLEEQRRWDEAISYYQKLLKEYPDQQNIAERMQVAFGHSGGWMDLTRGRSREHVGEHGDLTGHVSDEIPGRGFWRQWYRVMSATPTTEIGA